MRLCICADNGGLLPLEALSLLAQRLFIGGSVVTRVAE